MDPELEDTWAAPRLDLTPLIDGVFQLLIFFMVCTVFTRPELGKVDLAPAQHGQSAGPTEVKVFITQTGSVQLEDRAIALADLEAALREQVAKGREVRLTLLIDRRASHRFTLQAMEAAQRAGLDRVRLATRSHTAGGDTP
ncbi:MAG: biopolymer transporter ExbD [Candidatus Latescibacterota bacterium]